MSGDVALHRAYEWEKKAADRLWMTQPLGDGKILEMTFKEGFDQARRMAAHLKSFEFPEKTHIAIFSKNTAWWVLADLAIWMAGHVSVPLYATLTEETLRQILEHSEAKLIFVGKLDGYEAMAPGIPADLPRITMPLSPPLDDPSWEKIIAGTDPLSESPTREPDEMATIIYTSGSTGVPKGVMVSFGAMAAAAGGIARELGIDENDRMLSYLPLAHGFERWLVETVGLMTGFEIFFAESLDTFVSDLQRARPTLFISVPRLWQKFQLGVFSKMPPGKLRFLLKIPFIRGKVRKKILSALGLDAVRFAGSGSAPIPAELIQWYRNLGLELLEGYGLTENFSYSHFTRPGQVRPGYVGTPYPEVQHRISKVGEVEVKSPGRMMGYYKNPELTAASFTDDDFLLTGDVGELDELERLRITGRVKELFKTSKGKYVAPAPIENLLLLHEQVEMAVVSGLGQPQPYAIVMLSEDARANLDDEDWRKEFEQSLQSHLEEVNGQLEHQEQLQFATVVSEDWQIENGFLTPTMKIKRQKVEDAYGGLAQSWYDQDQKVVWHI